jgi:hypothetical protein
MNPNELTKRFKISCENCKTKFTIKYDEDNTDMKPMSCPFCSFEFDDEDADETVELNDNEGDEDETSWD